MQRLSILALVLLALPAIAAQPTSINARITTHAGKKIPLKLELATTPQARETGLMHRTSLKPSDGMAFFFPEPGIEKFWMKDTLLPLDMLFVDDAGKILYIITAAPLSLDALGPDRPVATVIELNGGRAQRERIAVGDKIQYDIATTPQALAR